MVWWIFISLLSGPVDQSTFAHRMTGAWNSEMYCRAKWIMLTDPDTNDDQSVLTNMGRSYFEHERVIIEDLLRRIEGGT